MALDNILGITDSAELARVEEQISKKKAAWLFESGRLDELTPGSFEALSEIHRALFGEIYEFAGTIRTVNIAKGDFRFAPVMYLESSIKYIEKMPQSNFDEIVEKYVLMNAMTDMVDDRDMYMKGIDHSYYYEGYNIYKADEL